MTAEGVAEVNTLLKAAAIVREWQGKKGERTAVHLEVLAAKIADEDAPLPPLDAGMCTPACDHEEPVHYSGLDRSFDDHAGMGQ